MFLALEEAPFVLQGPKPPIPPPAWASHGLLALVALGLLALAVFAVRRFLVRSRQPLAPAAQLELALRLAESQPPAAAVAQATRAFRLYLAAVEPKAAASLSTEELAAVLATLPVFLPARQPLLAALRSADGDAGIERAERGTTAGVCLRGTGRRRWRRSRAPGPWSCPA